MLRSLATMSLSSHFLHDFISVSHASAEILLHSSSLRNIYLKTSAFLEVNSPAGNQFIFVIFFLFLLLVTRQVKDNKRFNSFQRSV